jgi:hypothetical protein
MVLEVFDCRPLAFRLLVESNFPAIEKRYAGGDPGWEITNVDLEVRGYVV